jgi:hypothetical protein
VRDEDGKLSAALGGAEVAAEIVFRLGEHGGVGRLTARVRAVEYPTS